MGLWFGVVVPLCAGTRSQRCADERAGANKRRLVLDLLVNRNVQLAALPPLPAFVAGPGGWSGCGSPVRVFNRRDL